MGSRGVQHLDFVQLGGQGRSLVGQIIADRHAYPELWSGIEEPGRPQRGIDGPLVYWKYRKTLKSAHLGLSSADTRLSGLAA